MSEGKKTIIQVINRMDPGGIEVWLVNVLRHINRERFHFIFCSTSDEPGGFDEDIRLLGSEVVSCPTNKGYLSFSRKFMSILKESKCDVVHSHCLFLSGLIIRLAKKAGVPIRIAHSHASKESSHSSVHRYIYRWISRWLIKKYSTNGIACSEEAADYLFTTKWRKQKGYMIVKCAVDTNAFRYLKDRNQLMEQFNIKRNSKIIGHVGNFHYAKNHEFLLYIFAAMLHHRKDIHLFLIGDGKLRPQIQSLANQLGISGQVTFAGIRNDVPLLMRNLFDILVFPSLYEGLPVVILESQCAGLPSLISDTITAEVKTIDELVHFESLSVGADVWATRVLEILESSNYDKNKAVDQMEKSEFSITSSINLLSKLYSGHFIS